MSGKASAAAPDGEGQRILSLQDLSSRVDRIMDHLENQRRPADPPVKTAEGHGSVQDQVDRAVRDAQEKERAKSDAEKREAEINKRFEALEKKSEQPPREYNPLTRFLWGNE